VRTTTATAAGGAEASCVVTVAPDGDRVLVHLACTGTSVGAEVAVDLGPLGPLVVERGELVWHPDPHAVNDADHPDEVAPRPLPAEVVDDVLRLSLPPVSWASVSLVRPGADR
jgi:alpha-N-arabinofuranosidase